MGKRKVYAKTDLPLSRSEPTQDAEGNVINLPATIPPKCTSVDYGRTTCGARSFEFGKWYGAGIDLITYACQGQIERFLAGQDGDVTNTTVNGYCVNGMRSFLTHCMLWATALRRDLTLADVNRDLIDGYLNFLARPDLALTSQKTQYTAAKSVLSALGKRGLIRLVTTGDRATFPFNPYPNSTRTAKGEKALTKQERQAFTVALRKAIKPIWSAKTPLTSDLLGYALLTVALHTGRNTTPLLEMGRDCLHPHPKDNIMFLVLWKRRGYNTSKVALRAASSADRRLESTSSVKTNVESLIRRVMALTEPLIEEAPDDLKDRVWLYRSRSSSDFRRVTALTPEMLARSADTLIAQYGLTDDKGEPMRVNISRLRKSFANRIFELSDGDLVTTAAALGNTPQVADQSYLKPDANAQRNWKFMGEVLVQEALTQTLGATYWETPAGHCTNPKNGQYAPNREGDICMNFMNCLRCKNYAITAEDLYKLFSFYYRVLSERSRMDKRQWAKQFAHIPRLIDHYIVAEGIKRGTFKGSAVDAAREHARDQPHPFWSIDLIESLQVFT